MTLWLVMSSQISARQKSDETMVVGAKRWVAKVLLPQAAGPQRTKRVRGGTVMRIGVELVDGCIAMFALL